MGAIIAIGGISPNIQIIRQSALASSDYFSLLKRIPKITVSEKEIHPDRDIIKGKIEFRNIRFNYDDEVKERPVLDNLNLIFEPGKKIAIVGESGSGKSTIVNLIERLYEPIDGEILLDDINIKDYNLEFLRNLIGYVQQEPVLFNKSIKENIIFGREKIIEEIDDPVKLMKEACNDAFISKFIENNPDKYDYIVGIKGSKLSGGEKQRIAIARAILVKPKILILDEATSALDMKSEKEVQKALDNICQKNVTTIIIAHRLSTIKNVDLIYALKNGKVVEKGTHTELLEKNGYYAELVKSQISEENTNKKNENLCKLESKKSSLNKNSIDESNNFESLQMKEENVKVERGKIWELISENKLDITMGTIGGIAYGTTSPIAGFFLGKMTNIFTLKDPDDIKKKGLFWAILYIIMAFVSGLCMFLKSYKLEHLGTIISSKMRKNFFKKYLELHIGFFDVNSNSPGALLTKLSIDKTQLSSLVLSIFGALLCTAGTIITSLTIGFCFDWKLTLIICCFIPFIVACFFFLGNYRQNERQKDKQIRIESGSILSECAINTKTIFSFNFQSKALEMYKNILYKETKSIKNSLMLGFLIGIGMFIIFGSNFVIYKCTVKFSEIRHSLLKK